MAKCVGCGQSEFEKVGDLVCTNCGVVASSQTFADDPVQLLTKHDQLFINQNVPSSLRHSLSDGMTPGRKLALRLAGTIATNFCFTNDMKNYLMMLLKKALEHSNFYKCNQKSKEMLAGVCAYITMMNNDLAIAIQYMCDAVGCNGHEFGQIYNLFVETYPSHKPQAKPMEEIVPSVLASYSFNPNEMTELKKRVIDIICLERACWLIEGRSPIHLIAAASFLAWKSLKPSERLRTSFSRFCQLTDIRYMHTASQRVTELTNAMIKLANHIPIVKYSKVKPKVNKKTVIFYIDDIVKYPNSLIYDLQSDLLKGLYLNSRDNEECPDDQPIGLSMMDNFKVKHSEKRKAVELEGGDELSSRRLDDIENEDPEISEKEIESYLRSEREVKMIKKLRKRAEFTL